MASTKEYLDFILEQLMEDQSLKRIAGLGYTVRSIRRYMSCSGISNIIRSMMRGSRFWKGQRMP